MPKPKQQVQPGAPQPKATPTGTTKAGMTMAGSPSKPIKPARRNKKINPPMASM